MEAVKCELCEQDIRVTDQQRKRFDVFVCGRCYDKSRARIIAEMPEGTANFFKSNEEMNLNGKPCGISYMRSL